MSSSRIPAVLTALVTQMTAALDVKVYDGPVVTDSLPDSGLLVGANEDEAAEITFDQTWHGQGSRSRNETFDVPCLLFVRTGSTTLATFRQQLFDRFALIEQVLRNDPSLGLAGYTLRTEIGPGSYLQSQSKAGLVCRIRFSITVQAIT